MNTEKTIYFYQVNDKPYYYIIAYFLVWIVFGLVKIDIIKNLLYILWVCAAYFVYVENINFMYYYNDKRINIQQYLFKNNKNYLEDTSKVKYYYSSDSNSYKLYYNKKESLAININVIYPKYYKEKLKELDRVINN